MNETRLCRIAVADCIPTPDNPRVIDEKGAGFLALVASIEAEGVRIPIHARPHPDQPGKYDLRAGERRIRAALAAGVETAPAIIHEEMTDEQAFDLTFAENYCREDLTPLEEGRAVARLLEKHSGDLAAVAAHLGRSESWVAQRARLQDLSSAWLQALADENHAVQQWGIGHLLLVARLPEASQDSLFNLLANYWRDFRQTVRSLEQMIAEHLLRSLKAAPFGLDDASLTEAGACSACPRRSAVQQSLWPDATADDRCLDPPCWVAKERAWLARRRQEAQKKHGEALVMVSTNYSLSHGGDMLNGAGIEPKEVRTQSAWLPAKKADKGARPALVVDGHGVGGLRWVRPVGGRSVESENAFPQRAKSMEDKRAALESKRWYRAIHALGERIEALTVGDINGDSAGRLVRLAAAFGTLSNHCDHFDDGPWTRLAHFRATADAFPAETQQALLKEVCGVMLKRLLPIVGVTQVHKDMVNEARRQATEFALDLDALKAEADEAIREPKSWASPAKEAKKATAKARAKKESTT